MRILTVSDTHCGNVLGLTPPKYQNEENSQWLGAFWKWYTDTLGEIGPVDVLVLNGDLVDGPGYKDSGYHLTTNTKQQKDMAFTALSKVEVDRVFVVRGTGYHADTSEALEDGVAEDFGVTARDDLRIEVEGVKFHWKHVVGRSDTPYGQHTQGAKELTNDVLQGELEAYEHADQLIRSHVHYCTWSGRWNQARGRKQECWTMPAMQLRAPATSSFIRARRTWMYHVGMLLTSVSDGHVEHRPYVCPITLYAPKEREYICLK